MAREVILEVLAPSLLLLLNPASRAAGGGPEDIASLLAWLLSLPKAKKKRKKKFPHLNPRGLGDLPTLMATVRSLDTLDSFNSVALPPSGQFVLKA